MEKLCLSSLFSRNKLDVIDEKNINLSKFISKFIHLLIADRVNELIGKFFRGQITDFFNVGQNTVMNDMVSDRMQKVCFSKSHPTVDKEGVVVLGGQVGDRKGSRIRKLVAGSNDKILKCISGIKERWGGNGDGSFFLGCPPRREFHSTALLILDTKMKGTRLFRQSGKRFLDMGSVVFIDPLPEKSVRDLQFHTLLIQRDKGNRFNPDVEILLTNPLFQRVGHSTPKIFHGKNPGGLG
jgi:hypothetical protein